MQFSSFKCLKKILSVSFILSSSLFVSNIHARELLYRIEFDNNKPIDYKKIQERSSVFRAPDHWQAGINENYVWVEPSDESSNKFVFHARNGKNISNPNWAHKRAAGVRLFSW